MRAYLRAPGFVLSGAVLGLALVCGAACGGADSQDVLGSIDGAASTSSSGTSGSSGSSSGTSGSSSGTSGSSSGTSGSSGGGIDAAPDTGSDCPPETEGNNNKATANLIGKTLCGAISPQNDQDFMTFTLPATAQSLDITYSGDVIVEVTVLGSTVTLGNDAKIPVIPSQKYYIEVRGNGKLASTSWQVNVREM